MKKVSGASTGSREPSPSVSAASGFDPARGDLTATLRRFVAAIVCADSDLKVGRAMCANAMSEAADEIEKLRAALAPFARFIDQFERRPMLMDDEFYAIHMGTEFEASLRLSDLRRARAVITPAEETNNG